MWLTFTEMIFNSCVEIIKHFVFVLGLLICHMKRFPIIKLIYPKRWFQS